MHEAIQLQVPAMAAGPIGKMWSIEEMLDPAAEVGCQDSL
jgi:hypothetical protein